MSDIKELIREKIDTFYTEYKAKFHQNGDSYHLGIIDGLDMAKRILDTMPDEPEQPTRGYDEAYLNEKIAKASKSWEGVDVDKFMDEVRGREPVTTCNQLGPVTDCHDLEDEIREYMSNEDNNPFDWDWRDKRDCARHFAQWGAEHLHDTMEKVSEDLEEAAERYAEEQEFCFLRENPYTSQEYAFKAGAEWQRRQMMDKVYEEEVQEVYRDDDGIHCCVSVGTDYKPGTIVYVITIPKEDGKCCL